MKIEKIYSNGYRFYKIDGVYYQSITSILKLLSKEKINEWAIKQTINYIVKQGNLSPDIISSAFKYSKRYLQELADKGTAKHLLAQNYLLTGKYKKDKWLDKFIAWKKEADFRTNKNLIEKTVYSKKLGCAGTIDLLGTVYGQPVLLDIKTSSGIFLSHKIQVCGYKSIIEKDIKVGIIQISRDAKSKNFRLLEKEEEENYTKIFLALNTIFDCLHTVGELGVDIAH